VSHFLAAQHLRNADFLGISTFFTFYFRKRFATAALSLARCAVFGTEDSIPILANNTSCTHALANKPFRNVNASNRTPSNRPAVSIQAHRRALNRPPSYEGIKIARGLCAATVYCLNVVLTGSGASPLSVTSRWFGRLCHFPFAFFTGSLFLIGRDRSSGGLGEGLR
jgi:hypothetical protein